MKEKQSNHSFSKRAISKSVREKTVTHPISLYGTTIGLGSLFGFAMLDIPLLLMAGVGSLGLGLGSFALNYFLRYNTFAENYLSEIRANMSKEMDKMRIGLKKDLSELDLSQASLQVEKLHANFENVKSVLGEKLNVTEITYGRYLGVAEQLYLGALDNLNKVRLIKQSIETIDINYINSQLEQMDADKDKDSINSLTERKNILLKEEVVMRDLLKQNEVVMTRLVDTASTIAKTEIQPGKASMDLEVSMNELAKLTQSFEKYRHQS